MLSPAAPPIYRRRPTNRSTNEFFVHQVLDQQILLNGRQVWLVEWAGYSRSEATWEPCRSFIDQRVWDENIVPLQQELEELDREEVAAVHADAGLLVVAELRAAVARAEGDSGRMLDPFATAVLRLNPLTFQRVFSHQLNMSCCYDKKSKRGKLTTWTFSTTLIGLL